MAENMMDFSWMKFSHYRNRDSPYDCNSEICNHPIRLVFAQYGNPVAGNYTLALQKVRH